jgi:hypothetical protein
MGRLRHAWLASSSMLLGALGALGALASPACGSSSDRRFEEGDSGARDAPVSSFGDAASTCRPDPASFDIPGNGCDDDADGIVDNQPTCDADLAPFAGADEFAKALGLCKRASGASDPGWGVVSASFTRGHESAAPPADGQHGIMPSFGKVLRPREGKSLGVLSTGWARAYDDVQATSCDGATSTHCFKQGVQMQAGTPLLGGAPPGYPKAVGGCPVSDQVFDAVSLKLTIKVPKNARGFAIDFDFFSGEWPDYVCTRYNDAFLVVLQSAAFNGGVPENVAFDATRAPVTVNSAFFDRCTVGTQTGCRGNPPILKTSSCGGDLSELEDTGFFASGLYCNGQISVGGGATGWLTTTAPVAPGELMTLELLVWDTGDAKFDSSVLVDRFVWTAADTAVDPSTSRLR